MCGIIGYVGKRKASEVITEGLKRLEYRGYDSVGIAVQNGETVEVKKEKGMVEEISTALNFLSVIGNVGLGHTRWATHGVPCKANAHPHSACDKKVVLAHNGVIENFSELKKELLAKNHKFDSETDSEVIAHLIEEELKLAADPKKAFLSALNRLHGSYAVVAMIGNDEKIYVARKNSPLVIGVGKGEMFCASDIPAMLKYTKTFVLLEEGDVAVLSKNDYIISDLAGDRLNRKTIIVDWNLEMAEKGGYQHFMLKEIHDQKHFVLESLSADMSKAKQLLSNYQNIDIVACGTSYHAGRLLEILLTKELKKHAKAIIASEYQVVANPDDQTLVIVISQSGETADTLQAVKFAKKHGAKIICLTNVVGSSITRISDEVVYLNAGPEISVAATKTFTSQLVVIYKLVFGQKRALKIQSLIENALKNEEKIKDVARKLLDKPNIFFIGRGLNYPVAMEGALKLKEISYLHAEAYAGGELKHGPLSLIEVGVPVIAIAPSDSTLPKIFGNIKEVKARGAYLIAITDDEKIKQEADNSIKIEKVDDDYFYPFAEIISVQLLAYYVSILRGINPDKPRNLAKSVTVE